MAAVLDLTELRNERIFLPRTDFLPIPMKCFKINLDLQKKHSNWFVIMYKILNHGLSVHDVRVVGLGYFASGTFHSVIGSAHGVSQSTSFQCIEQFSMTMDTLFPSIVQFPTENRK